MRSPGSPADEATAVRILVVDDHAVVRAGLMRLVEAADEPWRLDEAAGGHQALEAMRRQPADLVVADLSMPGMNGLELIRRLRTEHPGTKVVVLSMHAEEEYAMRAFRAGANGYVAKDSAGEELVAAVRRVLAGGAWVSGSLAERVVLQLNRGSSGPPHARLTDRELEVLRRIVAGQRLADIALSLHLSAKTVSTHKRRIQDKLQIDSNAALVRYGLAHGLADGMPAPPQAGEA